MCHMDSGERRGECGITTTIVLYEYMINVYQYICIWWCQWTMYGNWLLLSQGYVVLEFLILFVEVCMNMITCEFRGQGPAGMPSALYCMDRC